ncbi:DUF4184 family protein [Streptomyces roseicoloratus]|uniref:DUF4184 family protein n=1 Tax=Streptomyces roseicoloratus TaxID=2508722 RepID=UPI001009E40A|nr:DUF4184 family protein [Streptomyces roseicoloratus]
MPFTLSHAAAVLPGLRRDATARGPLVASALVAGSFSPDMTYFTASVVPGAMRFGNVTHSFLGVVTVDVLITAVVVALWLTVREPLVALLPRRWRGRVHGFVRGRPWRERRPVALVCWFSVSAAAGATTHVVWDAFTHLDRWGTRLIPVLGDVVGGFPVYLYAQYGGSALALVLLGWFTLRALRAAPADGPTPSPGRVPVLDRRGLLIAWGVIGACVAIGVVQRVLRFYAYGLEVGTPFDIIPTICFGAGSGLALGVVLYGVGARVWSATRPASRAGAEAGRGDGSAAGSEAGRGDGPAAGRRPEPVGPDRR